MKQIISRYYKIAIIQILIILFISILVLFGWHLHMDFLKRWIPGSVAMNPVTALTFIISTSGFLLLGLQKTRLTKIGKLIGVIVLCVGVIRIGEIIFMLDLNLSEWFYFERLMMDKSYGKPNAMAPNTAFSFMILGGALITYPLNKGFKKNFSDYLATVVLMLSFISIVGYLNKAPEFYNIKSQIPMALPTAVCFFLFSVSILLRRCETGILMVFATSFEGSKMARLLIPFAVVILLVAGKLRLYGEENNLYSYQFGETLFTIASLLMLVFLIWTSALSINKFSKSLIEQIQRTKELSHQLHSEQQKVFEQTIMQAKFEHQKELIEATINGQEKERKQIGMELHDHINQILASTRLYLEIAKSDEDMREQVLNKCREQLTYAINEIRDLSKSMVLHTSEFGGTFLQINEMIENIEYSSGIKCTKNLEEAVFNQLNSKDQIAIYRIVGEQLNNILKHSKADRTSIGFCREGNNNLLVVEDNGKGFDPAGKRDGIGLSNIKIRTTLLDGELEIDSSPGNGCKLQVRFPAVRYP